MIQPDEPPRRPGPAAPRGSFSASSLQTLIVRLVVLVANLLTGIILARSLGPEALGVYYLLAVIPVMGFRFGNLGFGPALAFYAAKGRIGGRDLHRLAWGMGLILSGATVLALILIRGRNFSPWRDLDPALFYMFLISVPLEFWTLYPQRVLIGRLRVTQVNISAIVRGFGGLVFVILFVALFQQGIRGALLAAIGGMAAASLYLLARTARLSSQAVGGSPGRSTSSVLLDLWRYGRWTYLVLLGAGFCVQLPILVMPHFVSTEAIAFYGVSRALIQKTELLAMPFSTLLLPFTAAAEESDAVRRTNMLCRVFLGLMLILVAVLVVAVRIFIPLVYGPEYMPAVRVFWAASAGIVFLPLSLFLGLHIIGSGKPRAVFLADLGTLAVAAAACAVLIPAYGAVGAGWCYSLITAARFALRMATYRRLTGATFRNLLVPGRGDLAGCRRALAGFLTRIRSRLNGA